MTVDELIQLIRTCNLSQVRAELLAIKDNGGEIYDAVRVFYQNTAMRPK